jgi:hypothetical protein
VSGEEILRKGFTAISHWGRIIDSNNGLEVELRPAFFFVLLFLPEEFSKVSFPKPVNKSCGALIILCLMLDTSSNKQEVFFMRPNHYFPVHSHRQTYFSQ